MTKEALVKQLLWLASEFRKPYDDRDQDVEDGEIEYLLRQAAKQIQKGDLK